ncbi:THO complex subunit 5 [Geosmithia morbida]|uniref:THO complex subunit 5 n=1 Tax=Geosmithia morbida TaxID=1094350 RepID=A0A9P5D3C9_9HYPO|nr:THO complex subunit 5 [Geosmithia morbida]KAF4122416.1 THO complex subunit 5 [Geosmithia morbida]
MAIDKLITDPTLVAAVQISNQSRDQANKLIELINSVESSLSSSETTAEDSAAGAAPTPTPEQKAKVAKQQALFLASIAQLRGVHRHVTLAARDTKAQTAEARQEVDRLHLQLQNLYYEQRHLHDEIAACEGYEHKYQQLPLMPEDEFLAKYPEHADDDENTLMFARIDAERVDREGLEQQRQELLKRKSKLIADNKRRKDDLANLDNDLEKFIDAAKPIQKLFEKEH